MIQEHNTPLQSVTIGFTLEIVPKNCLLACSLRNISQYGDYCTLSISQSRLNFLPYLQASTVSSQPPCPLPCVFLCRQLQKNWHLVTNSLPTPFQDVPSFRIHQKLSHSDWIPVWFLLRLSYLLFRYKP